MTAFLLHEVGRLPADAQLGQPVAESPGLPAGLGAGAALTAVVLGLLALWAVLRKRRATGGTRYER